MEEKKSYKNVLEKPEPKLRKMIIQHIPPINVRRISQKQAAAILRVVKVRNPDGLTKDKFLEKAKQEFENMLYKRKHYCPYCYKGMWKKQQMVNHIAMIHEGQEKKFACESCPKRFMSTNSLEYHTNICHSEIKAEVKCRVCDAVFSHEVSLVRHQKIHEERQKEYKCRMCPKTFRRNDTLTKHKKSVHKLIFHSQTEENLKFVKKVRQFLTCKMCKEKFTGVNAEIDLETHIIRHCQDFKCLNCQKSFSSEDSLKQHMNTHKAQQVEFNCDKCNFRTNYKYNLKKHLKIQHQD